MKIEKINENKIKITVSLNDLEEREIDISALNYNSPAAQEFFWDMVEQAEVEFGFKASDSQLCIEAIPDTSEGVIITITKIDEDGDFESIHKYIKGKYKNNDIRIKDKHIKSNTNKVIYFFREFDDLAELTKKLYNVYAGESSLYKLKSFYYLVLTKNNLLISNTRIFDSLLSEFGNRVTSVIFYEGYLNEYALKLIDSSAIETINDYF
ncbi:MAG: adaptor protein MecA [Clostridiales bacterium]